MTLDLAAARELRGYRVVLEDVTDAKEVGILRAITPKDEIVLADQVTGQETRWHVAHVKSISDARVECRCCGAMVNKAFAPDEYCADCARDYARTQPPPRELCETCGAEGAFYSPRSGKFGCPQCQAKAGGLTGIGAEARVLAGAVCRADDIHSERHNWRRAKSSFVCENCQVKTFDKPASYAG